MIGCEWMDGKVVGRVMGGRWEGSGKKNRSVEWRVVGDWWDGGSRVLGGWWEDGGRGGGCCGAPLDVPRGSQGPARVSSENSGLFSSCEGPVGIPFKLVQWTRASSRVQVGNSGFLSSSDRYPGILMEIPLGSQTSSCVGAWNSASL